MIPEDAMPIAADYGCGRRALWAALNHDLGFLRQFGWEFPKLQDVREVARENDGHPQGE